MRGFSLSFEEKTLLSSIADNQEEKFGIDNLKKIQVWKAELIKEIYGLIQKKKKGGRVTGWAILLFFDDAMALSKILTKLDESAEEFSDLSSKEVLELNKVLEENLKGIPESSKTIISKISLMITTVADGFFDIFEEINS